VKAKFGVFLPFYAFRSEASQSSLFTRLRELVLECERLGFNSVWLDDHLMFGKTPILECWSTLSALASLTNRIRLGTMVTSNAFRTPALLAKMASTVDVVSNGRLEFGVGSGAQREEHEAYGYTFPKVCVRTERLRESLEIIKRLWTEEKASYSGKHHRIANAICEPKPVQKPHPPITVGGCGEKYTLRVTAQFADRFDFGYLPSIEKYRRKLEVLQAHCESMGRDSTEIERSCWPAGQIIIGEDGKELEGQIRQIKPRAMKRKDFDELSFVGLPADFEAVLTPYFDLGVSQFMLFFGDLPETSGLRLFSKTVGRRLS
jgi:F420-dependent oxidoreductase-like protein